MSSGYECSVCGARDPFTHTKACPPPRYQTYRTDGDAVGMLRRYSNASRDRRFRASCLAMSRFLTFVWMEAMTEKFKGRHQYKRQMRWATNCIRRMAFMEALYDGRLRLAWPEEGR